MLNFLVTKFLRNSHISVIKSSPLAQYLKNSCAARSHQVRCQTVPASWVPAGVGIW